MGNDYFETLAEIEQAKEKGIPNAASICKIATSYPVSAARPSKWSDRCSAQAGIDVKLGRYLWMAVCVEHMFPYF